MSESIEKARRQYLPSGEIQTLFVAEAPPANQNRFFYFETVPKYDWLYLGLMRAMYLDARDLESRVLRAEKPEYLRRFQRDGNYLIDASDIPMPNGATKSVKRKVLNKSLPKLISQVRLLLGKDTRVILISKSVYDVCGDQLKEAGANVVNTEAIDFPSSGRQKHFHRKMRRALDRQLEDTIRGLEASVEFFGAGEGQQAERDQWVVEHFLRGLGSEFDVLEIERPKSDPPDAKFRGAAFEVKEILERGRRRGDQYKQQLEKARSATSYDELLEEFTPEHISIQEVYERIMEETEKLKARKYASAELRGSLDLLFYVNLGTKTAWGIDDGHRPSVEPIVRERWRSVSFFHGSSTSCVMWASDSAPSFLRARQGQLVHGNGQ